MAELIVKYDKILKNINKLKIFMDSHGVQWSLITKVLSGHKEILSGIIKSDLARGLHSIGDSRLSSLKTVKSINPDIKTIYIKPPAIKYADNVAKYADISLNTSFNTIQAINESAKKLNKKHSVIIMVELGELREGILRENVVDFYSKVFDLSHIEIIGLGANLGCMYGIEPTYDKLIQLSLYKQVIEQKFKIEIPLVSGGSSINLPLIGKQRNPKSVNHLRIGEAVFCGTSPLTGKKFRDLSTDAFEFRANIIELEKKDKSPDGILGGGNVGHADENTQWEEGRHYRAILDFGLLDVDVDHLKVKHSGVKYIGTTSDMTVYDLGENIRKDKRLLFKVGGHISFNPDYMGVSRLMNSKFINKIISK